MKDKVLSCVREQVLKYGFRRFTIDDICIDLKISKKTIYKYFKSKDEIISEIVDTHVREDEAKTIKAVGEARSIFDKLNAAITCYYDYSIPLRTVDELKKFFPEQWAKIEKLFQFKQELFMGLINEGIEKGCIKSDISMDVLLLMINKTIPAIFDYEFLASHDKNRMTANYMLEDLGKLIIFGIAKN